MAGALDIKRRISSIKNTKKVTKAMEIVSAAKMKKAVDALVVLRPYAAAMRDVFESLGTSVRDHALLAPRDIKNICFIVIGSNKGLCGSFNAQIARLLRETVGAETREGVELTFITVGRKSDRAVKLLGHNPLATFPELNYGPDSVSVMPLVKMVFDGYEKGSFDKVVVLYTDYINPITQEARTHQILPVSQVSMDEHVATIDTLAESESSEVVSYTLEPSSTEAIAALVPRVVESQILHALLESGASKESSRMMAMKNATDAAGDIVDDLTLAYNKMRQAKITQEISEISAGRAALE